MAEDPEAGLAASEARVASSGTEVSEREAAARSARSELARAGRRAAPARSKSREASAHVAAIKTSLLKRHRRAVAEIAQVESEQKSAAAKHDRKVRSSAGLAIAALAMALILLAWGWFRASAAVAYLARIELGQAIGLCVGGGFVTVIAGAGLSSVGGITGAIGTAIAILGFLLPVAFLLARHSAEVQRGRARPLLRRERLPARAVQVLAGLAFALCLIGLGGALFAGEAQSREIGSETHRWAEETEPSTRALEAAEGAAASARASANPLLASVHRRQAALHIAERKLGRAEARLAAAEADARRFTRQLVALEKQEARELAREERNAQRIAEEEQRELEEAEEEHAELAGCDPNYEGECLTPGIGDYDCAGGSGDGPNYVYAPVTVVGVDVYGLDANGNGIGCEDE